MHSFSCIEYVGIVREYRGSACTCAQLHSVSLVGLIKRYKKRSRLSSKQCIEANIWTLSSALMKAGSFLTSTVPKLWARRIPQRPGTTPYRCRTLELPFLDGANSSSDWLQQYTRDSLFREAVVMHRVSVQSGIHSGKLGAEKSARL